MSGLVTARLRVQPFIATLALMVLARGAAVQRRLSIAFAERRVAKTYVAVVHGQFTDEAGEIDLPLAADWPRLPFAHAEPAPQCGGQHDLAFRGD